MSLTLSLGASRYPSGSFIQFLWKFSASYTVLPLEEWNCIISLFYLFLYLAHHIWFGPIRVVLQGRIDDGTVSLHHSGYDFFQHRAGGVEPLQIVLVFCVLYLVQVKEVTLWLI